MSKNSVVYHTIIKEHVSKSQTVVTMTIIMAQNEGSKETTELVGLKERGVWTRHLQGINHSVTIERFKELIEETSATHQAVCEASSQ